MADNSQLSKETEQVRNTFINRLNTMEKQVQENQIKIEQIS